ncbi:MAG: GrpB family protein [Pseudoxanthomonas suwonensis]|nr:GrpB family protein [Pseudoxanthomonas suwonensis]
MTAHRAPLVVQPWSEAWPRMFEQERERLLAALPAGFVIEHVGSTAVPELAAKPIVDMLLGASRLEAVDAVLPVLAGLGYDYRPEHEDAFPDRRFLAWPMTRPRRFHLHGVRIGGEFWQSHLAFRDRLRADTGLAGEYGTLKQRLVQAFGDDRAGYTAAKSPFIQQVLATRGD